MDLKARFIENVAWPLNDHFRDMCVGITCPIRYNFKRDSHFFDRIEERGVDKGRIASMFRRLFEQKYCELLYLFLTIRKSPSFKAGEQNYFIRVIYKDCCVAFRMSWDLDKFRPSYSLTPLTVLKDNDKISYDYSFEVD